MGVYLTSPPLKLGSRAEDGSDGGLVFRLADAQIDDRLAPLAQHAGFFVQGEGRRFSDRPGKLADAHR